MFSAMETFKNQYIKDEVLDYERMLNVNLSDIIMSLITNDKIYKIKNRTMSLQSAIFEYYDAAIERMQNQISQNNLMSLVNPRESNTISRENERILKNAIFPLFGMFQNFLNLPLEDFSIDQWFSRLNSGSLYYDEIGIGGTISHVTTEYSSNLSETSIPKNDKIQSILFHRILKVFNLVLPMLRIYSKNFEKTKIIVGSYDRIAEMGYDIMDKIFKFNLSIFTPRNQEILYSIGYFLINLINHYVNTNQNILYFIPIFATDIPFEIFKFLLNCKSPLLENSSARESLVKQIIHFKDDNFSFQILYFYTKLFSDSSIANPELKETFLNRTKYFLGRKLCVEIFEQSNVLVSHLIRGILIYMAMDSYASASSDILLEIIKPTSFGEHPDKAIQNKVLIAHIIDFFKSDDASFIKFMDSYNKYLNQVMTDFSMYLREINKMLNQSSEDNEGKSSIIRKFRYSFISLSSLMRIFEFLIAAYPKPFLDINSISFSFLASYLKNLCNRIVEKNYFGQIKMFFEKISIENQLEKLQDIVLPIIGLFLNITKSLNYENYNTFLSKIANLSDLDLDPFLEIYELIKNQKLLNEEEAKMLESFKEIIDQLVSLIKRKSDRKMSLDEWEKATKNDEICILCYTNPKDRYLTPCKHECCVDCLIQYLHSKKTCFICNSPIEGVEEIKK